MANAAIALAFLAGAEVFGDPAYPDLAQKALLGVVLPEDAGGSSLSLGEEKCWISEYAFPGNTTGTEYYVLNGFLFALLGLKLYIVETGETEYEPYYNCARNGYASLRNRFYYSKPYDPYPWTFYQLNFLAVEPFSYVLFDLTELLALEALTGDPLYSEELYERRNAFKSNFPFSFCFDYLGHLHYLFSSLGRPDPNLVFPYPFTLKFRFPSQSVTEVSTNPAGFTTLRDKAFLQGEIPAYVTSVEISGSFIGNRFFLYTQPLAQVMFTRCERDPLYLSFQLTCSADAECPWGSNEVMIKPPKQLYPGTPSHPENRIARLQFDLTKGFSFKSARFLGLLFRAGQPLNNLTFYLKDSSGKVLYRSLTLPLKSNADQLILLDPIQFLNLSTNISDPIIQFSVTIATGDLENISSFPLEIKELPLFLDYIDLYRYISTKDFFLAGRYPSR